MAAPKIFPQQPRVVMSDVEALLTHISDSKRALPKWLIKRPSVEAMKKALIVEVLRASHCDTPAAAVNRRVIAMLLDRIQKIEREQLENSIYEYLSGVNRKIRKK